MKKWAYVSRRSGNPYDCQFLAKTKTVQAIGPLPGNVGARSVKFEVDAESQEEAKHKIEEIIDREG